MPSSDAAKTHKSSVSTTDNDMYDPAELCRRLGYVIRDAVSLQIRVISWTIKDDTDWAALLHDFSELEWAVSHARDEILEAKDGRV